MNEPPAARHGPPRDGESQLERLLGSPSHTEYLLWLLVLAALTLDVYLTYRGLRYGLAEWNPVMRQAIAGLGFPVLGLSKVLVLGVGGLLRAARPEWGTLIPLAIGIPWSATVLVNLVMLSPL